MRQIVSFNIETDAVGNERGTTVAVPCTIGESMQAQTASVQLTMIDAKTDASLAIDVEKSLDLDQWVQQTAASSFNATQTLISTPFDCSGIGWLRARVVTAGGTATRAKVTFILTRTN